MAEVGVERRNPALSSSLPSFGASKSDTIAAAKAEVALFSASVAPKLRRRERPKQPAEDPWTRGIVGRH